MKRLNLLKIVAILWFLIGVLGVVTDEIKNHRLQFGYNFINVLVGIGLLNYWRIARWYALFVTGFTFAFMLTFLPWAIFNSEQLVLNFPSILIDQRPHPTVSSIVVTLVCLTYLMASGWCFWVLSRRDVRELFAAKSAAAKSVAAF